jgi:hypothetical protein
MQRLLLNTLATILVFFCLPACGKTQRGIHIKMEPVRALLTTTAVITLQTASQNSELKFDNNNPYIIIEAVSNESLSKFGPGVLGIAQVGVSPCRIKLANRLFTFTQDWINSVVWHEVGHCMGMEHTSNANDIMYPYANPLSWYTQEIIQDFIRRLYEATH